jgi:hypothetical protein
LRRIKYGRATIGHPSIINRRNSMRSLLALTAAATVLTGVAFAQSEQDHAAHHPPASSASAAAPGKAQSPTAAQVGKQMKSMQEMHDKMMAAKTAEERQALMADHMKVMQDGMAMMGAMSGSGKAGPGMTMDADMMGKRMDMMQMMMQMMMDREGAAAAPGK